jgi:hypothetical protein
LVSSSGHDILEPFTKRLEQAEEEQVDDEDE